VDWDAVLLRKSIPSIIPNVSHPGDTRNFERYSEDAWYNIPPLRDVDIVDFSNF
jgi:protein kinase X